MEEILASIRRIIAEDAPGKAAAESADDILVLTDEVSGPAPGVTARSSDDGRTLSRPAAQRVENAFADLMQAMQTESVAESPGADPAKARSGSPLDPLVLEALKPALRDWLDRNLAPLVERVVREEIARLVKRAAEQ